MVFQMSKTNHCCIKHSFYLCNGYQNKLYDMRVLTLSSEVANSMT